MLVDWLFDGNGNEDAWRTAAECADASLAAARQALERADVDDLSDRDRQALERALCALADARRSLQALDAATLQDAEGFLRELLRRHDRPATLLAQRA